MVVRGGRRPRRGGGDPAVRRAVGAAAVVAAKINWDDLQVAGAFVLGAVLATIATLRVVRAVTATFAPPRRRSHGRRPDDEDD